MRKAELFHFLWHRNELKACRWQINLNVPPMVLHIHINIAWLLLTSEFIGFPPSQIRGPSIDEYFSTCALCGTFIISFAIINRINEQSKSTAAAAWHTGPLHSLILVFFLSCCVLILSNVFVSAVSFTCYTRSRSKYGQGLQILNKRSCTYRCWST